MPRRFTLVCASIVLRVSAFVDGSEPCKDALTSTCGHEDAHEAHVSLLQSSVETKAIEKHSLRAKSLRIYKGADGQDFVLDVGAPRTGTQSLETALEMLGLRVLHSGGNGFQARDPLYDYLLHNGSREDALATIEGYDSAADEPYQLFYKTVMESNPSAKFILTMQETPQDWYRSYNRFMENKCVGATVHGLESAEIYDIPGPGPVLETDLGENLVHYWDCHFSDLNQTAEMVSSCLSHYNAHNQAIQREIPAEKLLIFDLADGWEPLCSFLSLPVPDEPFPHVDTFGGGPCEGTVHTQYVD